MLFKTNFFEGKNNPSKFSTKKTTNSFTYFTSSNPPKRERGGEGERGRGREREREREREGEGEGEGEERRKEKGINECLIFFSFWNK